jgi:hypothetical protein
LKKLLKKNLHIRDFYYFSRGALSETYIEIIKCLLKVEKFEEARRLANRTQTPLGKIEAFITIAESTSAPSDLSKAREELINYKPRSYALIEEEIERVRLFIKLFKISNEKYDLDQAWRIISKNYKYFYSPLKQIAYLVNYTKMTNDFRGIEIARKEAELLNKSCERLKAFSMIAEVTNDENDIKRVKEEIEICGKDVMTPLKFRETIKRLCQEKKFKQALEFVEHYDYYYYGEKDWGRQEIVRALCQEKNIKRL